MFSASSKAHEYLMVVLSEKLWSTWVFDVCVEQEAIENMSIYICVEREDLEHMSYETFVLSMKLLST